MKVQHILESNNLRTEALSVILEFNMVTLFSNASYPV